MEVASHTQIYNPVVYLFIYSVIWKSHFKAINITKLVQMNISKLDMNSLTMFSIFHVVKY